uniref:Gfd2/YDR514C-like C-terminal domain-containing protein n=1 Tax=Rhodosorus marinus TaxID=101924 RepID=A0A7S3A936_9RHOD|mmetsp:Transcript_6931/g.30327  ORF Transcript_6931/g.30327 Transcript_6931/m.30327 type:complete len:307 (+) Transcript_6931:393-1313(+)
MEEEHFKVVHVLRTWGRGQPEEKRGPLESELKEAIQRCSGAELFIRSLPEPVTRNGMVFNEILINRVGFASMKETAEAFAQGEVATIEPVQEKVLHELTKAEYKDVKDITQLVRGVEKHNKKVREKLSSQRRAEQETKRQTALIANLRSKLERGAKLLSVDIEAWERDQTKMLEIGAVLFELKKWDSAMPELTILSCKHFVVRENARCRNGRFVPDRRDHFNFGTSEVANKATIFSQLSDLVSRSEFMVGHGFRSDVKYLKNNGFAVDDLNKALDTEVGSIVARTSLLVECCLPVGSIGFLVLCRF